MRDAVAPGPLTLASAPARGPREIADFVGWAGARPPGPRRCGGVRTGRRS